MKELIGKICIGVEENYPRYSLIFAGDPVGVAGISINFTVDKRERLSDLFTEELTLDETKKYAINVFKCWKCGEPSEMSWCKDCA